MKYDPQKHGERRVFKLLRRIKPCKGGVYAPRVIRCDCGRAVTVNKQGEVIRHSIRTMQSKQCHMSWKHVIVE